MHKKGIKREKLCFVTVVVGLICFSSIAMSQVYTPQILLTGTFHGNEVAAQSGEKWLAVVPSGKGYTLVETRIRVEFVRDELQDKENEATGKKVSIDLNKKALFLVRGIGRIRLGEVETITTKSTPLEINRAIQLKLRNNRLYELLVVCEEATPLTVGNFMECSLILTTGYNSQKIMTFAVYFPPNLKPIFASDAKPSLIWAGDVDKDGALDLLLDLTNHYNISNPTLFLSSGAHNNDLVVKVAEFITYGD